MNSIQPAPPSAQPSVPPNATPGVATSAISPLTIADRLITLAQDADRAGYRDTASHLVSLVYTVLERRVTH